MTTTPAAPGHTPVSVASPARPAILGGAPAVTLDQTAANRWPICTPEDEAAVLRVLRAGEWGVSKETAALEDDYRKWLGVRFAVAHNNATGAILAGLHALGVSHGDEVIVPSATWWSSVLPVVHLGAVPVFAELEDHSLGLDPEDVERRITPRTKAIVVVHLFGLPSRMDELLALARRHNLAVLEDASHAHGAMYKGRPVGTLALDLGPKGASVFSMQGNKLCPTAEGGILLTNDPAIWENTLRWGHYERLLDLDSPNKYFAATGFGFKFRMSPLSAALARTQLARLTPRNTARNDNCVYLSRRLETLGCFNTFLSPPGIERVYFEYLIRYDESKTGLPIKDLSKALQAEGAMVGAPRYPLLHQQPFFTKGVWAKVGRVPPPHPVYDPAALPLTTRGNGSLLKLPSFPNAERALLDQYFDAFRKVLAHKDALPRSA
ncbi:MAG: DegT/DnrJ/EryC1/StrS family aminotransferase [Phycisphaerae bacterium]|nr:DegT/DnrJ/EryC1/StrS family aminotransferase [Phycisphaerae bacterium]